MTGPIVVGYDGSDGSQAALERALEEAAAPPRQLVIVAVAPPVLGPERPMAFGAPADELLTLPAVEPPEVERALGEARRRVDEAGARADYVWDAGDPADAILREARDRAATLVVVGKGHHSRLGRWLGTDVAGEVEGQAGCPVLVVGP